MMGPARAVAAAAAAAVGAATVGAAAVLVAGMPCWFLLAFLLAPSSHDDLTGCWRATLWGQGSSPMTLLMLPSLACTAVPVPAPVVPLLYSAGVDLAAAACVGGAVAGPLHMSRCCCCCCCFRAFLLVPSSHDGLKALGKVNLYGQASSPSPPSLLLALLLSLLRRLSVLARGAALPCCTGSTAAAVGACGFDLKLLNN